MANNIDDIFSKAIEPLNTEPTEEFWRKAAENVISMGGKSTERKVARWRAIAFILGVGLVVLAYFTYRIENGLENVDKQIAAVENIQKQNIARWNKSIPEKVTNTNLTSVTSKNTSINNERQNATNEATVPILTNHYQVEKNKVSINNVNNSKQIIPSLAYSQPSRHSSNPQNTITSKVSKSYDSQTLTGQEHELPKSSTENRASNFKVSPNIVSARALSQNDTTEDETAGSGNITDTSNTNLAISNTLKSVQNSDPTINEIPSRLSISAILSPDFLIGYTFKSTDARGNQSESTIKNGEKVTLSYTAGGMAEYAPTSNFSICAGLAYQVFSFNIKSTTLYNQKQSDGDVGYYLTTSSGVINCPYKGYSKSGDSIQINATSSRKYLEVPMVAKYYFMNSNRFRAYATAGIEVNFCLGESTVMNWQNFWNESGTDNITSTEGSRNMYFSYYLGMGVCYKMGNHLSVYIEPGLHEAVTPIDDNIELITYPKLFSVSTGITYAVK